MSTYITYYIMLHAWAILLLLLLILPLAICLRPEEPTFYSAATSSSRHGDYAPIYDRPRTRPVRRSDIIHANNDVDLKYHVNYGKDGHPYEQVQQYYDKKRRLLLQTSTGADNNLSNEDDIATRRILQDGAALFQPLRINFDTTDLDSWSMQSTLSAQRVEYITKQVLPEMAKAWSSALSVVRVMDNLRVDYKYCPFGDPQMSPSFSDNGVPNADLVIYVIKMKLTG